MLMFSPCHKVADKPFRLSQSAALALERVSAEKPSILKYRLSDSAAHSRGRWVYG